MTQTPGHILAGRKTCGLSEIPVLDHPDFRKAVLSAINSGARLSAFFGCPRPDNSIRLYAVLAHDLSGTLFVTASDAEKAYPALTPECAQAHWFEREIAEQWGLVPEGHPWLKPIRFHRSYRPGSDAWSRGPEEPIPPSVMNFFKVTGEQIHEVSVGPVHAGIIEPGHFRFQCHGETVHHLEISLGYQHRGIERAMRNGPDRRSIHYMEKAAGDTTLGHCTAYCQTLESLAQCPVPVRGQVVRAIALELERIANHVGDLGALAGDIGFLPTQSYCGRIRGDVLNLTADLCGNRFGRGLLQPGGVAFDFEPSLIESFLHKLKGISRDTEDAVNLLWDTPSVMARFESTGTVSRETAKNIGLVGPAARACGLEQDIRQDFPVSIYRFVQIPVSTWTSGDVFARACVRWLEIQRSLVFIRERLESIPSGPAAENLKPLPPQQFCISLVEGWRGEICHAAITDAEGRLASYKIVDPSFHNWFGLAYAMRGQQISDFPLCNKSFNLSYCGHDL
jgi:Ni,Fe-hydrogenase III large subunit